MCDITKARMNPLMRATIVVSLLILLSGCGMIKEWRKPEPPKPTYKYIPSVGDSVRFVVLPFNNYINQLEFAAKVENLLLDAGLNLVAPPRGTKTVEERKGAGFPRSAASGKAMKTVRIERYIVSDAVDAEYMVETMLKDSYGTIKFTRLSDHKIMGVITLSGSKKKFKKELYKKLEGMRFVSRTIVHG
ncbi:hypothetical protein [Desulfoluna spongiiphila]|uniref:Uncharacterized protein n=1 Tax=Desulfoluna spongiiphila TaxID=419481 RepID=A0A1G5CT72_9BACT|nr:hypothetical protein [Desulfoluna spongiiphila]SCY05440.1 hypothetical protein SAMN05216233_103189 [Desulfoluna spongiiphila]VVS92388.1 prokaryotic membrane lipoprotein lipid attachment site profile [Desulfoluna spongiiphila]